MMTIESELKRVRQVLYQRLWQKENRDRINAAQRAYRKANPEQRREGDRKYRECHKAEAYAKSTAWRKANPERFREIDRRCKQKLKDSGGAKAKYRKDRLSAKYGMSPDEWDILFLRQGSKCAICSAVDPGCSYGWNTDHDHLTNKVRGILCNGCNLMIGHAKDNIDRLRNAITYLSAGGVS